MEILGVGPLEIILVLILALVVLGPQDMVATAFKIGAWVRKMVRSPTWREIADMSREIRQIPTTIMRDSGLREIAKDVKNTTAEVKAQAAQVSQELSAEGAAANQDLKAEAGAPAPAPGQLPPTGMPPLSPEFPPTQPWTEASGNQPAPPKPEGYPQTIPLGSAEAPQNIPQPPAAEEAEEQPVPRQAQDGAPSAS